MAFAYIRRKINEAQTFGSGPEIGDIDFAGAFDGVTQDALNDPTARRVKLGPNSLVPARDLMQYDIVVGPDGKDYDFRYLRRRINLTKQIMSKNSSTAGIYVVLNMLTIIPTFGIETMGVDGVRFFVNPAFANSLSDTMFVGVFAHEAFHIIYQHIPRGEAYGMEHELSNIAGDYEINYAIEHLNKDFKGVFSTPGPDGSQFLYDEQYANMAYEDIYEKVKQNPPITPPTPPQLPPNISQDFIDGYKDAWNAAVAAAKAAGILK